MTFEVFFWATSALGTEKWQERGQINCHDVVHVACLFRFVVGGKGSFFFK